MPRWETTLQVPTGDGPLFLRLARALAEDIRRGRFLPGQKLPCARSLLRPGDTVAVEALGYRPAWDALRFAGATLASVPVDSQGLDVEALAALCRQRPVRALYLTPHHQYPTTVTLSPGRRLALLELARRHRLALIEDDYDHEFHYEGRPVLPLASADDSGHVVYLGTLSKVLAPGLRLGFIIAPQAVIQRMVALRSVMDRQGDLGMEAAVAELIEEGELQRHVRKMRRVYLQRRDVLVRALADALGHVTQVDVPRGGISLWARVRPEVDVDAWVEACAQLGVRVASGRQYAFDGQPVSALRLVFAPLAPAELARAVERMAEALEAIRTRLPLRAKAHPVR